MPRFLILVYFCYGSIIVFVSLFISLHFLVWKVERIAYIRVFNVTTFFVQYHSVNSCLGLIVDVGTCIHYDEWIEECVCECVRARACV